MLTTDGDLIQRITHPRYGCVKTYDVKIKKDLLPVVCSWTAEAYSGRFNVDKGTEKKLTIYVRPEGPLGPIDEKTEVHEKRDVEIKDVPFHQEEVVE